MRTEQLRYFLRILEVGSFRKAADQMHLSQAALSESLKALERELGAQLMERGRSGVSLTSVGREVLPYIRAIVESETALKSEVDDHRGLHRGLVRIGTTNAGANTILPSVLRSFHDRFPGVQLQLTEAGSLSVEQQVKSGDFDVGLLVSAGEHVRYGEALVAQPLLVSHLVVCVPRDHPFSGRRTVEAAEVAREPLILFRTGYFMHDLAFQILEEQKLNVVFYTDNTQSVKRMIAAGIGLTILPQFSVYPDLLDEDDEIRYVPLQGDSPTMSLNLIRRRHSYVSRAVRELWSDLVAESVRVNRSLSPVADAGGEP